MAMLVSSLFSTGCSVFGYRGGTETPNFSVIDRLGRIEIRHYDQRLAADTIVANASEVDARATGFKRLANYIFGDNTAKAKIAMTAPVSQSSQKITMTTPVGQQQTNQGWRVRFFLPRDLTMATAPQPNNGQVTLTTVAPENYAVLRFSNSRGTSAVEAHIARLRQVLSDSRWQPSGPPAAWFYDPPWTLPFRRRNEVALPVHAARPDTAPGAAQDSALTR